MATRLGIDVGGTFTDLVFFDDATGRMWADKRPTTPGALADGIMAVITAAVGPERLKSTEYFLHGTTVGINAVLERKGATVGLLTTRNFRDVLDIRRGEREHMLDLMASTAVPLVPRHRRLPVTERVLADGSVLEAFDPSDVDKAYKVFRAEGVESVAIVFLHAYANPVHELAAEKRLRELGFDGFISLSHAVSGEFREYERTSTTVVDAYVRPRLSNYLTLLDAALAGEGFEGERLVTRSGGGAMTFAEAQIRPFETIMSGPAAGAVAAGELARVLALKEAIGVDVGGTSTDVCLVVDGQPAFKYEGEVDGMPLQAPWVDVRSIGAGGGSIAFVDAGRLLRVGPHSAGAVPGPVSYGRGGTEATVTDAAGVLGMLGEGHLAAGVNLDLDAAREALDRLGHTLDLEVDRMAAGIMQIASAAMASAIRSVTVERGHDPRDAALIMAGGAGGLFGTLLADELDVNQVIVPNFAGNFSAWGLLGQDITRTASLTSIRELSADGLVASNEVLQQLFSTLVERAGPKAADAAREAHLDLRYEGQEHAITIQLECAADDTLRTDAETAAERFKSAHQVAYGHTLDARTEIVAVRATLRTRLPRRSDSMPVEVNPTAAADGQIDAHSFSRGERIPFTVVERSGLEPGAKRAGPMIIVETTATTYIDAGFSVTAHPTGALLIARERN